MSRPNPMFIMPFTWPQGRFMDLRIAQICLKKISIFIKCWKFTFFYKSSNFCLLLHTWRYWLIEPHLKVEIEDGHKAPWIEDWHKAPWKSSTIYCSSFISGRNNTNVKSVSALNKCYKKCCLILWFLNIMKQSIPNLLKKLFYL